LFGSVDGNGVGLNEGGVEGCVKKANVLETKPKERKKRRKKKRQSETER